MKLEKYVYGLRKETFMINHKLPESRRSIIIKFDFTILVTLQKYIMKVL